MTLRNLTIPPGTLLLSQGSPIYTIRNSYVKDKELEIVRQDSAAFKEITQQRLELDIQFRVCVIALKLHPYGVLQRVQGRNWEV